MSTDGGLPPPTFQRQLSPDFEEVLWPWWYGSAFSLAVGGFSISAQVQGLTKAGWVIASVASLGSLLGHAALMRIRSKSRPEVDLYDPRVNLVIWAGVFSLRLWESAGREFEYVGIFPTWVLIGIFATAAYASSVQWFVFQGHSPNLIQSAAVGSGIETPELNDPAVALDLLESSRRAVDDELQRPSRWWYAPLVGLLVTAEITQLTTNLPAWGFPLLIIGYLAGTAVYGHLARYGPLTRLRGKATFRDCAVPFALLAPVLGLCWWLVRSVDQLAPVHAIGSWLFATVAFLGLREVSSRLRSARMVGQ